MKHSIKSIVVSVGFLAATGGTVLAQTTVYSDDFTSDSALSSTYLNMNSVGSSDAWAFTADTQLQLQTAGSSKLDEVLNGFNAVTLGSAGQYITMTVNFNSGGSIVNNFAQAGGAGNLLMAFANSGGVALGGGSTPEAESSTANTGQTHGDVSYAGMLALNTTPKTSSKFFVKTASGLNGVAYSSDSTPTTQLASESANYAFSGSDNYTLTYTLTYVSATQLTVSDILTDDTGTPTQEANSFTVNTASATTPTLTLDTFDFGLYTGSETAGYDLNITDFNVVTTGSIAPSPEPSVLALGAAGVGLLGLIRRRRS
ncbi:MAG TPA: PEP-CTERM sorting domain-containing protein [Verrucomicrobiae bacterium]|jgi:MYXO-CTERM domain-containing protein